EIAVDNWKKCPSVGFITMMWIVPVTASKWNVTFASPLREASLQFLFYKNRAPQTEVRFAIGENVSVAIDGITRKIIGSQSEDSHGTTTYTFQLEHPQKKRLVIHSVATFYFDHYKGRNGIHDSDFWTNLNKTCI
ncbi:hypothetical protein PFISCL1PPCAC_883, partial [Pristionchus fissidentatus]